MADLKIGDEVYIHGFVDEVRRDTVIIRNKGGYFGTVTEEIMPSAQPEIVRCKECKYWMPHSQLGFDEDNGTYHDYCARLVPEDEYYAFYRDADDYCSRAERRSDDGV